jgi:DNA-binding CsgD family transcriptional regulator
LVKRLTHIAIVEPSHIIYEGLANILLRSEYHFQLYRLENLEELEHPGIKGKMDIVVLNPALIQQPTRHFMQLKLAHQQSKWIGLVYAYFDRETISVFDGLIHITDTPETIVNTVYKQTQTVTAGTETATAEQITERETEVLIQLVHGLSNKEIADKLNISIHTVVSHRKNIVQKTGIKSQAGLTIYAISNKIISLGSYSE